MNYDDALEILTKYTICDNMRRNRDCEGDCNYCDNFYRFEDLPTAIKIVINKINSLEGK